jgi:hypothetical protein
MALSVKLVAGTLLAGAAVLLTVLPLVTVSSTGCATQETTDAPDGSLPPCKPGPFIFCTEVGPDKPGCNTVDGTHPRLAKLPRTRYAVGCVVDYVGERDEQGNCKLDAVCKCQIGDVPPLTPAEAGVEPDPDAGDAGDDAEAGTTTPPPPVDAGPTSAPIWNCYP